MHGFGIFTNSVGDLRTARRMVLTLKKLPFLLVVAVVLYGVANGGFKFLLLTASHANQSESQIFADPFFTRVKH